MDKKEKCIKSNVIFEGHILTLNCDDVLCSNQQTSTREVVHHHGGVCILAEYEGKIAFVQQYRYAYQEEVLELPAGKIEKGEDPYKSALRELEEETGLIAESLDDYGIMYPSPGYTDEKIYLYVAKNIKNGRQHLDNDEVIDVIYLSDSEINEYLKNNVIKDAKTICLLYKYFGNKKGN